MTELYKDSDFALYGDYNNGFVIVHCEVTKWSARVYRRITAALLGVLEGVQSAVYAPRIDDKQERFMRMFGFEPSVAAMIGNDGRTYELFKKEYK